LLGKDTEIAKSDGSARDSLFGGNQRCLGCFQSPYQVGHSPSTAEGDAATARAALSFRTAGLEGAPAQGASHDELSRLVSVSQRRVRDGLGWARRWGRGSRSNGAHGVTTHGHRRNPTKLGSARISPGTTAYVLVNGVASSPHAGRPRSTTRHVLYERRVGMSASITFRVARLAYVTVAGLLKSSLDPKPVPTAGTRRSWSHEVAS
jgi:hypothetical protein